jgi:CRP/FNR family transcriptional regulator, cyclic AMP receptor protein
MVAAMASEQKRRIDWKVLLAGISKGKNPVKYSSDSPIFRQGEPADSLLYLRRGKVRLSVVSKHGKEAIVAILKAGEFFGEGCLAGQRLRMATATAMTGCTLDRLDKLLMTRILHERHAISELFVTHLLARNIRYEAELVHQLFNSCEKQLARILLLLSHFGKESRSELMLPRVNFTNLARMIGTTRSQISLFMKKFKRLGFIDYSRNSRLIVQSGLLSVVLHD